MLYLTFEAVAGGARVPDVTVELIILSIGQLPIIIGPICLPGTKQ